MVSSRPSTNFLKNHKNDPLKQNKLMDCRRLLSHASISCMPANGDLLSPTIFLEQKELLSCRRSLSHSSINLTPANGIKDAKPRACTGKKNEMVGSRRSTTPLIESKIQ
ncbi:hypothetical protein [Ignatzschineria cameli]|uniref:hypothetical protein n=1 Tax=Ignatzschineria cameli TaxID=2182793 RepID=UPI001057B08A|nr:hypothetical protein [Ignatzschineria cameli]